MKNTYTIEDYIVLHSYLKSNEGTIVSFDFFEEVVNKAIKIMVSRELKKDEFEGMVMSWLSKSYKLYDAMLRYRFVYEIEFDDVALYINILGLKTYVQWRLKISK
jgi:hypothetical protein